MKIWAIGMLVIVGLSLGLVSPAADFNGDGTNDIGIFRPSSGLWAVRGVTRVYFGGTGDNPAAEDYNGDGTDEIAVSRPATGLWAVRGVTRAYFGNPADITLGGDGGRWLPNGSDIYYNAGKVGIGTTDPKYPLHVHKNSSNHCYVAFTNESTGSGSTDGVLVGLDPNEDFRIHSYESNNIEFYIANDEKAIINSAGNVGVGTSTPSERLTVKMGGYTWSDPHFALEDHDSTDKWDFIVGGSNKLFIGYNESTKLTMGTAGRVGIGTTAPEAKLHVYGDNNDVGLVVRAGHNGSEPYNDIATFYNGGGGLAFWFAANGAAGANDGWTTFSPYISMHFIPADREKGDYAVGDLVSAIDSLAVKTRGTFDSAVVGVVCPPEGFISIPTELKKAITEEGKSMEDFELVPVAYLGNVRVKVNNEGGSIRSGDLIVPSSVPGEAMKGEPETFRQYSSVIGKAREDFDGARGLIWVSVGVK